MLSHKPQAEQGDGRLLSLSLFLNRSLSFSPTTTSAFQATERWNPGRTPALRWQHLVGIVARLKV